MENSKIRELLSPRCISVQGQFTDIDETGIKELFTGATDAHKVPDPACDSGPPTYKWLILFKDESSALSHIKRTPEALENKDCSIERCTVYCEIPDEWLSKYDPDSAPPVPPRQNRQQTGPSVPEREQYSEAKMQQPPNLPPQAGMPGYPQYPMPLLHTQPDAGSHPQNMQFTNPVQFQQFQQMFINMMQNMSDPQSMPNTDPALFQQQKQMLFNMMQHAHYPADNPPPYSGDEQTCVKQALDETEDTLSGSEIDAEKPQSKSEEKEEQEKPKVTNMIQVTKIPEGCSTDSLMYFFENRRKSGGGDVQDIDYDESSRSAVITFEDSEVVKRVIGKVPLLLNGKQIHVEEFYPNVTEPIVEQDDMQSESGCTIEVHGVKETTSRDTVENYFENTRRSGGGPVENAECIDSVWRLTFESEDIVENVLKKQHKIDGVILKVDRYVPPPPPKPVPMYDNRVFIKGLNPETTQDGLDNFLEAKTGITPTTIEYGEEEGTAMVTFEEELDFQRLQDVCKKRRLDGHHLEVQKVPITNCIIVTKFGEQMTSDTMEFYFDNKKRSGGYDVTDVKMDSSSGICLVYFEDSEVLEQVLKRKHTVNGYELQVQIYYECLGQSVDNEDSTFILPEPVDIEVDHRKLQFLMKSKPNREAVNKQLASCFAKPIWPAKSEEAKMKRLKCECTLTSESKDCRKIAKSWKKDVQIDLDKYLNLISVESHTALQEAWKLVLDKLKNVNITNPDAVAVLLEKAECKIFIVGHKLMVTDVSKQTKDIILQVNQELDHKKQQVKENVSLKHHQILVLQFAHFDEDMNKEFKGFKMTYDLHQRIVIFSGLGGDIINAKLKMFELVNNISKSEVDSFSKERQSFLQTTTVRKYVGNKMKENNVIGVWEIDKRDTKCIVCVYSLGDKDAVKAAHILKDAVVESSIQLEEESIALLTQSIWKQKVSEIENMEEPGMVSIVFQTNQKTVILLTTDKLSAMVREMVTDFFNFNTVYQQSLELAPGIMRFLQEQNGKEIKSVSDKLTNEQVEINISNTGIYIKGTKAGLNQAKAAIDDLVKKVETKKHKVEKAGISKFIQSEQGIDKLSKVEKAEGVVVEVSDDQSDDSSDENSYAKSSPSRKIQEFANHRDSDGHKILAVMGDMTELDVDVLVNAANKDLKHIGGLAKVLVDKGGRSIQEECNTFIKKHGKIMEGDVFLSQAGNLRCKAIVHAVAPVWQNNTNNEEEYLREAVLKSLEKAAIDNFTSIAIPALGTGVFGYPIREATKVITEAVRDHFTQEMPDSSVNTVYLIDVKDKTVEFFVAAMQKIFGTKSVTVKSGGTAVGTWQQRGVPTPTMDVGKTPRFSAPKAVSAGGISIQIIKGQISKQLVDVIVNTTSRDLKLSNGAVSNSLLQAGGATLQQECNQNYPNGIRQGDVAITTGGNLNCRHILHGSLPSWSPNGTSVQIMLKFMKKCLEVTEKKRLSSVAFPAMGTGNLGYPRDVVAREMFSCVTQYATQNPSSTITDVKFVLYDKDVPTVKAFEMEESRQSGGTSRQGRQYEKSDGARYTSGNYGATGHSSMRKDKEQFILDMGKVTLKVYQGDITQAQVDAIVNSTNPEFDLDRGVVSRILIKRGGSELRNQVNLNRDSIKKDGIAVTTACDRQAAYHVIIHVDSETSHLTWQEKIEKILIRADSAAVSSVALPALGTAFGIQPEKIAKYVFNAIVTVQNDLKNLQEVHVVLFEDKMMLPFLNSMQSCCKDPKAKKKTLFSKFTNFIGFGKKPDVSWENIKTAKIPVNSPSITLIFYGRTMKCIERAISKFESHLDDVYKSETIEDPLIKEFTSHQESYIKCLEKHGIDIKIEKRIGRIKLHGCIEDIHIAKDEIHKELRKALQHHHQKEEEKFIADMVEWCFIDITNTGQKLEKYPPEINLLLEREHKKQKPDATFTDNHGKKYIVDFNSYEEYPEDNTLDKVKVIRRSKIQGGQMETPPTWSPMDKENVSVVQLKQTDQEYQDVIKEMVQTTGQSFTIIKVERIQNRMLYQQYIAKKTQMEAENSASTHPVERSLWHGTDSNAVASINTYGFNRSYCGKNATVYGNGVYFALNANYSASDTYSPRDASSNKRMYWSKVLTGDIIQGSNRMIVPPAKHTNFNGQNILYDSVVDNVSRPGIFVIFNDTQAYPEYLITFQ